MAGESFDASVDRCFILQEIGSTRKVKCGDGDNEILEEVYNFKLTSPLGEVILLTAWGDHAAKVYSYFR